MVNLDGALVQSCLMDTVVAAIVSGIAGMKGPICGNTTLNLATISHITMVLCIRYYVVDGCFRGGIRTLARYDEHGHTMSAARWIDPAPR